MQGISEITDGHCIVKGTCTTIWLKKDISSVLASFRTAKDNSVTQNTWKEVNPCVT